MVSSTPVSSTSWHVLTFFFAVVCSQSVAFIPLSSSKIRIPQTSSTQIGLFQGLFGGNKKKTETFSAPSAGKAADATKLKEMKSNLAKIGNTQKRDYEAEAKARAPPPKVLQDKQTLSFNFNKPNEFPNLFKGK